MRLSLALGGGGARGLAHIHVLEALDDLGVRPVEIAGSSIGAMMATAYASGMSGRDLRDYTLARLTHPSEVLSAIWRTRPVLRRGAAVPLLKPRLTDLDSLRTIRAVMPPGLPERVEALGLPVTLTVTDFYSQTGIAVREGPLLEVLAAAIAIPAVFCPVQHGDRVLIDGGIANPVPFDLLGQAVPPADVVMAVDVIGAPVRHPRRLPNKREQLFGASQIMMQAMIREKAAAARLDVLIRPPVDGVAVLDFLRARRILEATAGVREETKRRVEAAFAQGAAA